MRAGAEADDLPGSSSFMKYYQVGMPLWVWVLTVAWGGGGCWGVETPPAAAQEEGIFADFNTSLGSFTCRLDHIAAPKTVASFIGLATGERAWLDKRSGQVRTDRFLDGLVFHRVIAGFMVQSGSPKGDGSDGPGYAFPDEFNPGLRHDGPGVLSMANSGPASNGSQFFITVTNTPWLDDRHTVFGRVTSGLTVVQAISQVATDKNTDKPLTDVILERVTIRRVGAAAHAFDPETQNLPVVSQVPLGIRLGEDAVVLAFTASLFAEHCLRSSSDLLVWTNVTLGIDLVAPALGEVQRATSAPVQFYSLARVQYPATTFAPRTVHDRTLVLSLSAGLGTLTIRFDSAGGGTYDHNGSPGLLLGYDWIQDPYRGRLWPIEFSAVVPMTLRLDFTSDGGGTFEGTAYAGGSFGISGSFTLSGP